jgi:hypothetical protein
MGDPRLRMNTEKFVALYIWQKHEDFAHQVLLAAASLPVGRTNLIKIASLTALLSGGYIEVYYRSICSKYRY